MSHWTFLALDIGDEDVQDSNEGSCIYNFKLPTLQTEYRFYNKLITRKNFAKDKIIFSVYKNDVSTAKISNEILLFQSEIVDEVLNELKKQIGEHENLGLDTPESIDIISKDYFGLNYLLIENSVLAIILSLIFRYTKSISKYYVDPKTIIHCTNFPRDFSPRELKNLLSGKLNLQIDTSKIQTLKLGNCIEFLIKLERKEYEEKFQKFCSLNYCSIDMHVIEFRRFFYPNKFRKIIENSTLVDLNSNFRKIIDDYKIKYGEIYGVFFHGVQNLRICFVDPNVVNSFGLCPCTQYPLFYPKNTDIYKQLLKKSVVNIYKSNDEVCVMSSNKYENLL